MSIAALREKIASVFTDKLRDVCGACACTGSNGLPPPRGGVGRVVGSDVDKLSVGEMVVEGSGVDKLEVDKVIVSVLVTVCISVLVGVCISVLAGG